MRWVSISILVLALAGCSFNKLVVYRVGNVLAEGSQVYAGDDDPDLVGAAMPFGLKTIESLLAQSPHHKGLLLAAASGFTQYAYAFVQTEADLVEDSDLMRAIFLRERALRLYRRALGYGIRGLEEIEPGFSELLRSDCGKALATMGKQDVPFLYWTASAWGAAISLDKTNPDLAVDLPRAEALIRRALELDEKFGLGAIYDFMIVYEGGRPAAGGGSIDRARESLGRAIELSGGRRASPMVSFAETVDVAIQDRAEFKQLLDRALAINIDDAPDHRLSNIIAQRRARWLLARMDRLFID
ncbi:MAG TPA: TRAP transporter TatT component family protein [Syntrophobacteraceae bacterium]|nr:TRAP transporter TatT component family protein [Syntrophobacteraceae bacterium]